MEEIHNYVYGYIESSFPTSIDTPPFVQDISLSSSEWRKSYTTELNEDADTTIISLKKNNEFTPVEADLFHMLQNRVISTGAYVLTLGGDALALPIEFGTSTPSDSTDGKTWLDTGL